MASPTYIFPGTGTVEATAVQAFKASRQVATIDLLTTDTTFNFNHNWALTTAELALLFPVVIVNPQGSARGTLAVSARHADQVVFDATVTVAGVFEVVLDRPHSILMPRAK